MGHSEAGRGPTQTPGAAATAAPTSSAGGGKAGRLAPVTPHNTSAHLAGLVCPSSHIRVTPASASSSWPHHRPETPTDLRPPRACIVRNLNPVPLKFQCSRSAEHKLNE